MQSLAFCPLSMRFIIIKFLLEAYRLAMTHIMCFVITRAMFKQAFSKATFFYLNRHRVLSGYMFSPPKQAFTVVNIISGQFRPLLDSSRTKFWLYFRVYTEICIIEKV